MMKISGEKKKRTKRAKPLYARKHLSKKITVKNVKAIVKKAVVGNLEHKKKEYSATRTIFPYLGAQDTNVFPLSPFASYLDIQQGTGDGARVGNQIKILKGTVTFTLWPFNYNVATNAVPIPQDVMFVIFYDKNDDTNIPTPSANGDFYQNNNTTAGFSGNLTDLTRWINLDRYTVVYKKLFKLGFAINQVNGADANNAQWSNNDYKLNVMNHTVDYTKHLIKHVKFNDNNSNPTTRGLFGMFITVPCNGAQFGSAQVPSTFTYQSRLIYTDA